MSELRRRIAALPPDRREALLRRMARAGSDDPPAPPPIRAAGGSAPVLSPAQERLWVFQQLDAGGHVYNCPAAFRLRGPLDAGALAQALDDLTRRHEILRTRFPADRGRPTAVVEPHAPGLLAIEALAGEGDGERAALERALVEARRPFDLAEAPPLRARLWRIAPDDHLLLLVLHHILADAWSLDVLLRELAAAYDARRRGEAPALPPLPIQYADFARWQREALSGPWAERHLAYWNAQLAGAPPRLALPLNRPLPVSPSYRGARIPIALRAHAVDRLRAIAREERATLFMVLLSALEALLHRVTGQEDVVIGTPVSGRTVVEAEPLIGCFVRLLPLRLDAAGDPPFRELVRRARGVVLDGLAHEAAPSEQVERALRAARGGEGAAPIHVVFALDAGSGAGWSMPGLATTQAPLPADTAKFDLTLNLLDAGGGVEGVLEYAADRFDADTAGRLGRQLVALVESAAASPGRRLSELDLVAPADGQRLAATAVVRAEVGPATCLHRLFEAQAARTPESVAVTCEGEELRYAELDRRAEALARRLRARGVAPSEHVGLCVERSLDLVVAIVGILKAGAAYVPLDPEYPAERLAFLIADSGAARVVTLASLRDRLPVEPGACVCLDEEEPPGSCRGGAHAGGAVTPDHPAYVIYTSGSTGSPRGVLVAHRHVSRLFEAARAAMRFGAGDVWSLFHSFAFDFSVWELWGALLHGGRVVVVPRWVSRSPEALWGLLVRERVTILSQTPSAFRELARLHEEADIRGAGALRYVVFGGEALDARLLAPWLCRHGDTSPVLINMYGITETTVHVTHRRISAADPEGRPGSFVGGPLPDLSLSVMDPWLRPVPAGAVGEICVGGAGVSYGYLGRSALTALRFVPDPLAAAPGARLYRSGDLGRLRGGGDLEYLGRGDQQVKVRGFRIEVEEIEACLRRHPAVAAVVVRPWTTPSGDRRLAAWYVARAGEPVSAADLRALAARSLPPFMVPAAFAPIGAIPLTVNGKLDVRALPTPEPTAGEGRRAAPPRTATEEVVAALFAAVLEAPEVGADGDFFELGGHSLLATQLVSRVREAFGVELPLRALFEARTVAELARRVDALRGGRGEAQGGAGEPRTAIARRLRSEVAPLSVQQERLWILDRLQPESSAFLVPLGIRVVGPLGAPALARALDLLVRRHESLRTVFEERDVPVQRVLPHAAVELPCEDLSGLPEAERSGALLAAAQRELDLPLSLTRAAPWRARLLRVDEREHVLLLTLHHILVDGWSCGLLLRELEEICRALAEDRTPRLPEPPAPYAEYARWQREALDRGALDAHITYWRRRLEGAPALLPLPLDLPRPPQQSHRGARHRVELAPELTGQIRALCRAEGATLFSTLLAALQALLCRVTGEEDLCVGTYVANRRRGEIEGTVGFFVNTLVLRTSLAGDPSFRELARRARDVALDAYAHEDAPFERVIEAVRPARDASHTPLFQVLCVLQRVPRAATGPAAVRLEALDLDKMRANFDLSLWWVDDGDRLSATFNYCADLFEAGTIARLAGHLVALLEGVVERPDLRISEISLLRPRERAVLLSGGEPLPGPKPEATSLVRLIGAQATRTPEAVAIEQEGARLTYRELVERAEAIARYLALRGVRRGDVVGLCIERSPEQMLALLGILVAGAAYLPLDPTWPADRLAYMLVDSGASALLTRSGLAGIAPFQGEVIRIDADADAIARAPAPAAGARVGPHDPAYVIYTSGSTGRPRGVIVPHRAAAVYPGWLAATLGVGPGDRVLQLNSLSWDTAAEEIFAALTRGATLVLRTEDMLGSPATFVSRCNALGLSVVNLPTAYWHELCLDPVALGRWGGGLRAVIIGGAEARPDRARAFLRALGGRVRLLNTYGATETAMVATCHELGAAPREGARTPIGCPITGCRVYVLDRRLEPAPVGAAAELFVGGAALAAGYLGRPALTAERFVPDPFNPSPGARMYRTGDDARWLSNGSLEFLGRRDGQVKIRGFRVEPGEIERALSSHPAVADAVVAPWEPSPGDLRIAAYVELRAGASASLDALREHLAALLPTYLHPAALSILPALPRTPGGKIDRGALPAPQPASRAGCVPPRTPVERALAAIWEDLLGVAGVGVEDSFFDLGGHSLLATRLLARVRQAMDVEIPLRSVFEGPTIARLAAEIDARRAARAGGDVTRGPRREPREGPIPLSFAQQRLWFLERLGPAGSTYHCPGATRITGPLDVGALRSAIGAIVRRHEVLRTRFPAGPRGPTQVIEAAGDIDLPVEEIAGGALEARLLEEIERRFDLDRGQPVRARLFRLAPEEHVLLIVIHHIAADAWSFGVLHRELATLYPALAAGEAPALPELPIQYADHSIAQRRLLEGPALESGLAYWRERLAGCPPALDLPLDRPRPAVQSYRGALRRVAFSRELAGALRALARARGATLFMTLAAGLFALLRRLTGQDDLTLGTPVAGRTHVETEGLIGCFINTLVLRADLPGDPSFSELLAEVREITLGAFAHEHVPFERVVDAVRPERSLDRSPLFQVMLILQNAPAEPLALPGLALRPVSLARSASMFDLTLSLRESREGLVGQVEYSADLFEGATIDRMIAQLGRILAAAAVDPEIRIGDLPLLSGDERRAALARRAEGGAPLPGVTLVDLFAAQVARAPEETAWIAPEGRLTYGELSRRANRLAHHLRALGVGPEVRVGVRLGRGLDQIVALLAVLTAGGAYVPIDPAYPPERQAYMLADSRAPVVLTSSALGACPAPAGARVVRLDLAADEIARCPDHAPPGRPSSLQAAYVIYTSGTTGQPKGVVGLHRGAVNRILWMQRERPFAPGEVACQKTALSFVDAVAEIFGPLLAGVSTVVVPEGELLEIDRLLHRLREARVTRLVLVPSLLAALVEHPAIGELTSLRQCITSGEALPPELARRALRALPGVELLDLYGSSEVSADATWHVVDEVAPAAARVPVGRPIAHTRVHVLDSRLEPAPIGVAGEIYVAGAGLARGYLDRPGLTAARFVPDPLAAEPGERMYRTGDLGRYRADGALELLGRRDDQVKVRGFRIEPAAVEAALAQHPGVREAIVAVRRGRSGREQLAAFCVLDPALRPPPAELRRFLEARLPPHEIPSAFVPVSAIPLGPSGKRDRRRLPEIDADDAAGASPRVPPRTPAEAALARAFSDVLGLPEVSVHDGFFELGGDSILSIQVVSRAAEAGLRLTVADVFRHPTVAALAEAALAAAPDRGEDAPPPPPPGDLLDPATLASRLGRDIASAHPLSPMQEGLLFHALLDPGSGEYVEQWSCRLHRPDLARLRDAWQGLVDRHDILRTGFHWEGLPQPLQAVERAASPPWIEDDWRGLDAAAQDARLEQHLCDDRARGFALDRPPLLRMALFRLGEDTYRLVWSFHHLLLDGWCLPLVLGEVDHRYAGGAPLAPARPYSEHVAWLRRRDTAAAEGFWRGALRDLGEPAQIDLGRAATGGAGGYGEAQATLDERATEALSRLARREGLTLATLLQGAWALLLSRYTGAADVVFGVTTAGRPADLPGAPSMLGLFVNTLPVRARVEPAASAASWLRALQDRLVEQRQHEHLPLWRIQQLAETAPGRPLFDSLLVVENYARGLAPRRDGRGLVACDVRFSARTHYPLTLQATPGARLRLTLKHRQDRLGAPAAERLLGHLAQILRGLAEQPARPLRDVPLLPGDEARRIAAASIGEPRPVAEVALHRAFEAQARRTPEAIAVVCGDAALPYAELDRRANQLARLLARRGAGPEATVAVLHERSIEMVIALLAVLKAGAAYVPLDPELPPARLAAMIEDSGAALLIAGAALAPRLPPGGPPLVCPALEREATDRLPDRALDVPVGPDHAAYVIFTSGTTGRPKGAVNCHGPVLNRLAWMQRALGLGADDRVLQKTSYGFDVSVWEIFWPLLQGARLVLAEPGAQRDPARLAELIGLHGVTTAHFVPSALAELLRLPDLAPCRSLRRVIASGEALPPDLRRRALDRLGAALYNLYGPTEAAIDVTWDRCSIDDDPEVVPIGRPIDGAEVLVLDGELRPVPVGVPGELFLGGVPLARGYVRRPGQTAARFVPHPTAPGARLYATGDRARRLPDGRIEYLGRLDHQVKIRGHRVELGEIEAALRQQPEVDQALVMARHDHGELALAAYLVPRAGAAIDPAALRRALRSTLPDVMIPSSYVALAALPLTANGKVDRRALPAPEASRPTSARLVLPRTRAEEAVLALFRAALDRDDLGVEDDFFDLGGHSIRAMRLVARAREQLGVELPLRAVFERRTAARLAELVEAGAAPEPRDEPIAPIPRDGALPLSFAQQGLWFLDQLEAGSAFHNTHGAVRLKGRLDASALEAALEEIVRRHEVLRARFPAASGLPTVAIDPPGALALPCDDLSGAPDPLAEAARRASAEAHAPFDLARGPLFRARLLRLGPADHVLSLTLHHIVSDGWSLGVLTRELGALYAALSRGEPSPLPPLPVQYVDYAAWQRRRLGGPRLDRQLAYWRARLAGPLPVLELPAGAARPERRTFRGAQQAFPLPPALAEAAAALGRREGCTLFMTLLAAFCVLLRHLTGQTDLLVGTPIAGRTRVETEALIGLFINTLVLRADLGGAPRFVDVLRRVREAALGAFAHQDVPFERLVAELNPERRPGHTPLFQVAFGLHNAPHGELDLPDLTLSSLPGAEVLVRYDLTVWVTEGASGLRVWWTYRTDLFTPATIASMAGRLRALLELATATPETRIDALDLRTAEERQAEERRGAAVKADNLERWKRLARAKDRSGPA